jgi:hypothetical protein
MSANEEGFMLVSRLLVVSVLIAVSVAAAAAQSAPDKAPASSALPLALPQKSSIIPSSKDAGIVLTLEPNDITCFSTRTYRVTRDDPDSDSVRFAGYSTCLPANRVQLKVAVDSLDTAPR